MVDRIWKQTNDILELYEIRQSGELNSIVRRVVGDVEEESASGAGATTPPPSLATHFLLFLVFPSLLTHFYSLALYLLLFSTSSSHLLRGRTLSALPRGVVPCATRTVWPAMSNPAYLPTEIVVYIAQAIYEEFDDLKPRRLSQSTLYNCCLVSRQWYSAAVAFLYKRPLLTRGGSFAQFTKTVCPPYAARKKVKVDLGSLVQWLDLSHLVHESTPSVMGRLLNRTQSGLRVFIAPTTSFSYVYSISKVGPSPMLIYYLCFPVRTVFQPCQNVSSFTTSI